MSELKNIRIKGIKQPIKPREITIRIEEYTDLNFFSLKNFRQMKTPFAFVDETGALNLKTDPYFALGLIKTQRPQTLYPQLRSLRSRLKLYPELRFYNLTYYLLPLAKGFIDIFIGSPISSFNCIIIPKHDKDFDPEKYFNNDIFEIYRKFLTILIKESIGPIDILTVLADDYFCPYNQATLETFEGSIRALVNARFGRLALTSVCQINSKSSDFIQLTDLILGCVVMDLKIQVGLIKLKNLSTSNKVRYELLQYLKEKLGMSKDASFFARGGKPVKAFTRNNRKFKGKLFDPRTAVHVIRKSEPSPI